MYKLKCDDCRNTYVGQARRHQNTSHMFWRMNKHTKVWSILCKDDTQPVVLHLWTQEKNDIYTKVVNRIDMNTHLHAYINTYICRYKNYTFKVLYSQYEKCINLPHPTQTTNSSLLLIIPHLKDAEISTTRWNTRQKQVCMRDTNQTKAQYLKLLEMRYAHIK